MISSNTMNLVEINARDGKWFEFTEQRAKVCIVDEKCLVGRRHQLDALHEIEKCIIPLIVIGLLSILFSWVVLVCMRFMFYHHFSFFTLFHQLVLLIFLLLVGVCCSHFVKMTHNDINSQLFYSICGRTRTSSLVL